jgi:sulfite exporter TauE/SafE
MARILLSLFLTGIIFGAGPCLASCGPILISYIISSEKGERSGIVAYLLFSMARIAAYLCISVAVYLLGNVAVARISAEWVRHLRIIAGVLIMLVGGVVLIGKHTKVPHLRCMYASLVERGAKSIFVFGLLIGLLPCAPLMALFSYSGLIAHSFGQSLFFALTFGIGTLLSPLLLLAFASGALNKRVLNTNARFRTIGDIIAGGIIVFLGAQLALRF